MAPITTEKTTYRVAAKTLKGAVVLAASALPKRTAMPILNNLLLRFEDSPDGETVTVTGMDLAVALRVTVNTGTLIGGPSVAQDVCVNGTKLADFVSSLPDHQPIEIAFDGKAMVMTCARARGRFLLVDPEEFPPFPGGQGVTPALTAMGHKLAQAINAVRPFTTTDKARPYLSCVYLWMKDEELTTMGADAQIIGVYRAADYGVPEGQRIEFKRPEAKMLVPESAAATLAKIAEQAGTERVTLSLVGKDPERPSGILVDSWGAMTVSAYARLQEDAYPAAPILTLFPSDGEAETMPIVPVYGKLLTTAVKRVSTFGNDSVFGVPINLTVATANHEDQATMHVQAAGAEQGEGDDQFDCTAKTGYGDPLPEDMPLRVRLGSRYILTAIDAIKNVTGADEVYLGFREGGKAFTFQDGTTDYRVAVAPLVSDAPPPPAPPPAEDDEGFGPESEDLSEA